MKKRKLFGLLALTTLAAVLLASCDDNSVEPDFDELESHTR